MASIFDWSVTAADNDDADTDINWLEGQAGNTVNNSARAMMAKVASLVKALRGVLVTGGSGDNYTLSLDFPPSSLATKGWMGVVRFNRANTTATPNFEISGLSTVDIVNNQGVAPAIGEILLNSLHLVVYDPNASRIRLVTLAGASTLDSGDITDFDTAVNTLIEANENLTVSQITDFTSAVNTLIVTIDEMTAETGIALGDYIPIIDVSEGATVQNKMTVANFLKAVDLLTDAGTPASDDKIVIWDESASEVKTILVSTLSDGWVERMKTTTESRSSTTTLTNDSDLTIPANTLDVGSTYALEWDVIFESPATPDFKFDIETNFLVGGVTASVVAGGHTSASAFVALSEEHASATSSLLADTSITGAGFIGRITLTGFITIDTVSVEVQFRWAQNTSNATASRVFRGSKVRYKKVA